MLRDRLINSYTGIIILINIIAFVVFTSVLILFSTIDPEKIFSYVAVQPAMILAGKNLWTLITHMFMGFLAGSAAKIEAAELFLGGDFTVTFWAFVVVLGLIFPAVMEIKLLSPNSSQSFNCFS